MEKLIMYTGFILAAYSVVANDVIQTLGTFISSNKERRWQGLWLFSSGILLIVIISGWMINDGDVSFGRLARIPYPEEIKWYLILPPLALLVLTQFGLPVSTTFMILSVFSSQQVIEKMVIKSIMGYAIAFVFAFILYLVIARKFESKNTSDKALLKKQVHFWVVAQWISTGFLWSQWLIQDFANIFVYLPRQIETGEFILSVVFLVSLLAIVFRRKGGRIQQVVVQKTNTANIRSATLIDLSYALVLYLFTVVNPLPMSTTWAFVGILAGREYAINYLLNRHLIRDTYKKIFKDLYKVNAGLIISVLLALLIRLL